MISVGWFRKPSAACARPVGRFTYDTTYLPSSDKFHRPLTGGQVDANFSLSPPLFFPFLFSFRFISMDLSGRSTRCQITRALRPTFLIRRHLTPFLSIVITARYLRSVSFLPFFSILSNITRSLLYSEIRPLSFLLKKFRKGGDSFTPDETF